MKDNYSLYNPVDSIESYINMLINHDSNLTKNGYLMGIIIEETEILEYNEYIANKLKSQKYGEVEIQELH